MIYHRNCQNRKTVHNMKVIFLGVYYRFQRISGITYLQVFGHIFENFKEKWIVTGTDIYSPQNTRIMIYKWMKQCI